MDALWMKDAACAQSPLMKVGAWDSDIVDYREAALKICAECPVRKLCYDYAVEDRHADGINGGVMFKLRSERSYNNDPMEGVPEYVEVSEL